MEAAKCPKCGEEPAFIEHIEKWYCYGCNSYIDDGDEKHECEVHEVQGEKAAAVAHELKSLDEEDAKLACKNCGAELEDLKGGRLFCFVCETYQDEIVEDKKEEPKTNEAQVLLDSATIPKPEKVPEPDQPTVVAPVPPEPAKEPEARPTDIRMCSSCNQPLKFIDKYQRYYCYGCRKYAPMEDAPEPSHTHAKQERAHRKCPDCSGDLKYIEKYSEYYCYSCKKYPLRSHKRAEPAKAVSKPKMLACPKCGEPFRWVEKYSRHYCGKCKEYAPKGFGGVPTDAGNKKECPACKEAMKFIPEYNEWYCFKCKKYSLRPNKPVLLF